MDSTESTLEATLQEEVMPSKVVLRFGSDAYRQDGDDDDDDDDGTEGKTSEDESWKSHSEELESDRNEDGHCQEDAETEDQLLNALKSKKGCIQNQSTAEDTKSGPHAILPKNSVDVEWLMRFDELAAYREENGHCNVTYENRSLYNWVLSQRRLFESKNLNEERKRKLDSIRFVWKKKPWKELVQEKWNKRFDELAAFHKKNGHCTVSTKDGQRLYDWVQRQRQLGFKLLGEDRKRRLESIGFEWSTGETLEAIWEERFDELSAYHEVNGHCNVTSYENRRLYNWVHSQRRLFESKHLDEDRKRKLDSIRFDWTKGPWKKLVEEKWNQRFDELTAFQKKNGHCLVSKEDDERLFGWVRRQRRQGLGRLGEDRKRRLESIGFEWIGERQKKTAAWEKWKERFDELSAYHETTGHCNVKSRENRILHSWITEQRRLLEAKELSEDRKRQLDSIAFEWNAAEMKKKEFDARWQVRFDQLAAFHRRNGHCNVSARENRTLNYWVHNQRRFKLNNQLREDRKRQLDLIGFEWDHEASKKETEERLKTALDAKWKQQFDLLAAYHEKNGHSRVLMSENTSLHSWRLRQCYKRESGCLDDDKKRLLDSIGGFDRNYGHVRTRKEDLDAKWKQRFHELAAYHEENGHCYVTECQDPTLHSWVCNQRSLQWTVSEDRKRQLDSIGFDWNTEEILKGQEGILNANWTKRCDELAAYYEKNRHFDVSKRENETLCTWVLTQQRLLESNHLREDRKSRLDSIGFEWDWEERKRKADEERRKAAADWRQQFDQLATYQKENGHCHVLRRENQSLYEWRLKQRSLKESGNLDEDRLRQLDSIGGFDWNSSASSCPPKKAIDPKWKLTFDELAVYQKTNGHCNVTRRENATLYEWVCRQRQLGAKNVGDDRKSQLDSIGFDWHGAQHAPGVKGSRWDDMFNQLQQFRENHGHCNVTVLGEDRLLCRWVSLQRNLFGQGRLSERQKERLESIDGFYFVSEAKGRKDDAELDELDVDDDDESHTNNDAHSFSVDVGKEEGLEVGRKSPWKSEATNMSRKKCRTSYQESFPEQKNRKPVSNRAFSSSSSSRAREALKSADNEVVYGARRQVRFGTMVALEGMPHPKQYKFRYEDGTTEILSGDEAQEAYDLGMSEKESYLQKRVAIMFDGRPLAGTIVSFREVDNRPHWKVEYDNGKEEELDVDDVKRFISLFDYIRLMGS